MPASLPASPTASVTPAIRSAAADLRADLARVSRSIHAHPETRFVENHAAELLTGWLEAEGFAVKRGAGELPTAFVARHEGIRPGPTIAVLLEYDALPDLGHGCGHSLIAAGGGAAAISVIRAREQHAGTLLVIGTPGEEGGGGKIRLLEAGVFQEVDAAVMFHPADRTLAVRHGLAAAHLGVRFHGRSAHAAKNPESGRSALAGLQLFFAAVDMLRQFVPDSARLHGVIVDGGQAPNVVPARAEATFWVRDLTRESVVALVERVRAAAQGAALATGTTVEVFETTPVYAERHDNRTIAGRCAGYLTDLGITVEPESPDNPAGSSDIGNVSRVLPTIHPYLQIAERGTPSHSEALRDAAVSDLAHGRAELMAAALAQTVCDLLEEPDFLAAARQEFTKQVAEKDLPLSPHREKSMK